MSQQALTAEERRLGNLWDEHMRTEFVARRADETIETMVANPRVHQVPVMTGGEGREEVYRFYAKHFLPQIPPDMEIVPVSRTIGQGRLVDVMVARFTHSIVMDWMLPGLAPTGKPVEVGLVVIVQFDGDALAHEQIYWDQASVLAQLGYLRADDLPVVGAEGARSILDRSIQLNGLLRRAQLTRGDHVAATREISFT
jgi:carboxymethylenebutenolidase